MEDVLIITSDADILESVNFKPYRSKVERRVIPFMPMPNEVQFMDITTPWGAVLTAKSGDFLISEIDKPNDFWPIDATIFEESYILIRPGYCIKKAVTMLAPLTEITRDPNAQVTIVSLEGAETVRAEDFYLAKGVQGEIWAYPKEKIEYVMMPAE